MYADRVAGVPVCVVDMTHGGMDLCAALSRRGALPVAVDVHRTLKNADLRILQKGGIPVFASFAEAVSAHSPEVVMMQYAPDREAITAYCGETGLPLMTHAKATGLILGERLASVATTEITGARGKSTVMGMLSSIMSHTGEPSLFMTSMGAYVQHGSERTIICGQGSITPSHALHVVDAADAAGCAFSSCFLEISLGGTGLGDVCSVLGIPLELRAGIGRSAFFSKAQMAELMRPGAVLNVNASDPPSRSLRLLTGTRCNVVGNAPEASLFTTRNAWYSGDGELTLNLAAFSTLCNDSLTSAFSLAPPPRLFGTMAVDTMLAAAGVALALGVPTASIRAGISAYEPLPRRMVFSREGGVHRITNTATSKETTLLALDEAARYARIRGLPLHAVVGGRTKTTCGAMDLFGLAAGINTRLPRFDSFLVYGELGRDLSGAGCAASFVPSVEGGAPLMHTQDDSVVIACIN